MFLYWVQQNYDVGILGSQQWSRATVHFPPRVYASNTKSVMCHVWSLRISVSKVNHKPDYI